MAKRIYIIAGEASGDNIGSLLIRSLKENSAEPLEFYGIGGPKMEKEGLKSIFSMREISLIGFVEIIPHFFKLMKRLKQTVKDIIDTKPDCLITIDSPGFNKRIAASIKEQAPNIKRIHYVAPTVWAYKPERAKRMAELFHHLLVLLPFEPPYFEAENLPTTYTGHPIFENFELADEAKQKAILQKYNYTENDILISLLVGSRAGELKRLLPVYLDAVKIITKQIPSAKFVFLVNQNMADEIVARTKQFANIKVVAEESDKRPLLQSSKAAIVKSGTVSLEVAACKTPMIITYKVSNFSARMLRKMIKIEYVTLINIIENRLIIPEYLQEDCTPEKLANGIIELIQNPELVAKQVGDAEIALKKLSFGSLEAPSLKAAQTILKLINS